MGFARTNLVEGTDASTGRASRRRLHATRAMSAVGRLLIIAGAVVLLFVAYQLWGTGFREAASQRALRSDFEQQLSAATPAPAPAADGAAGGDPVSDEDPVDGAAPDPETAPSEGPAVGGHEILRVGGHETAR